LRQVFHLVFGLALGGDQHITAFILKVTEAFTQFSPFALDVLRDGCDIALARRRISSRER
jgi:hypothetical protein